MVLNVPKRPKNWKMEPVPALLNSLYRTFGKRTVFGNWWRGPRGQPRTRRNAIKKSRAQTGACAEGAKLNVPQEEMVLNVPKRPKNWKMEPVPVLLNSLYGTLGKRAVFCNWWRGRPQKLTRKMPKCEEMKAHKAKMKEHEAHKAKMKKMKAQKAKMKGNEGPQC